MISPIYGERVLSIETPTGHILLIADLHIGITYELSLRGINIPSQAPYLINACKHICDTWHPTRVILLGDVKHVIPRYSTDRQEYLAALDKERREVRAFLGALSHYAQVDIIPGNHDGNLHQVASSYTIHPSHGICITGTEETVGVIHGHAWPSRAVMQCDYVIMGHTHPTIQLRDHLGYTISQPCWVKSVFSHRKTQKRYGDSNPQLIVVPPFNPLCGGIPVNVEGLAGPLGKLANVDKGTIYLLNGTNLGKVENLRRSPESSTRSP